MSRLKRLATVLRAGVALSGALAAAQSGLAASPTDAEIAYLMKQLKASSCQFDRNGSVHNADEAVSHLQKKHAYMSSRVQQMTTEAFITEAASQSSISGQPYWVRCPGQLPMESKTWLMRELARYRAAAKAESAPVSNSPAK